MRRTFLRVLAVCGAAALARSGAWADTVKLTSGSVLTVNFWLPGLETKGLPGTVGIELWGIAPPGTSRASIPGSSQEYYSGPLFSGALESLDGSVSIPLFDADAWRLGLPTGNLVAAALYSGGAFIEGQASLTFKQAAVFGRSGQGRFVIRNLGGDFTIGLEGYSLSNAVLEPVTSRDGAVQSAARTQGLSFEPPPSLVPEPRNWPLVAAAAALLAVMLRRQRFGARRYGAPENRLPASCPCNG